MILLIGTDKTLNKIQHLLVILKKIGTCSTLESEGDFVNLMESVY